MLRTVWHSKSSKHLMLDENDLESNVNNMQVQEEGRASLGLEFAKLPKLAALSLFRIKNSDLLKSQCRNKLDYEQKALDW